MASFGKQKLSIFFIVGTLITEVLNETSWSSVPTTKQQLKLLNSYCAFACILAQQGYNNFNCLL